MPIPIDGMNFHDGYTSVTCRTTAADRLVKGVEVAGFLRAIPMDLKAAKTSNKAMGAEKRHRAFRVIESDQSIGRPVPDYGLNIPNTPLKESIPTSVNIFTHGLCFFPKFLCVELHAILSPLGYYLLWANK